MRKLILLMHVSLDGYVAGPVGEMNWIKLNDQLFDFVGTLTKQSDTGLYGRNTFEMMENYWPNAGSKPGATKHDKEHSAWYNSIQKVVLSRTMKDAKMKNTLILSSHLEEAINSLKQQKGKDILMLGSPSASHSLTALGLIDEYWLFINPILLGQGILLFKHILTPIHLKLIESRKFEDDVLAVHYKKVLPL